MSNAKIVHLKASQSVFAAAGGRIGLFGYEEEAGTMRFQYGASPTVDVAYAALRNSPNTFSGANTFQTVTVRDVIVHNQSGTSQSIGYVHSTSGNLRLITRFDETVDAFDIVTRNDDGNARNTALRIPRTTATAVNAGGSGGQPWNFTGGIWTGGTQCISSAGRFDATSLYNSAWAGSGVRPLLTDNAGMGYATDAATFRSRIGAIGNGDNVAFSYITISSPGSSPQLRFSRTGNPVGKKEWSVEVDPSAGTPQGNLLFTRKSDDLLSGGLVMSLTQDLTVGAYNAFATYDAVSDTFLPVVGSRKPGWSAATGTPTRSTFATGSVTLPQLAERVKALIDDLISHGLIGA